MATFSPGERGDATRLGKISAMKKPNKLGHRVYFMAHCGIGLSIGQIQTRSSEGVVVESGVQTGQHPLLKAGALIGR